MSFAGIRPVLHTPFAGGGQLALPELERLVQMAGAGVSGLVTLGLASEARALSERERDDCLRVVVAAAGGLPVTIGIDGGTRVAVDRARRAAALGVHSLMVLPPKDADLGEHFGALAAVGLPMLAQDAPQVSGISLTAQDLLALRDAVPAVAAVKIEGPAAGPKISALTAAGMAVVAGWGGLHFPEALRRGACGLMPGCDLAAAFVAIHGDWLAGREDAADDRYDALLPYLAYEAQSLDLLILAAKRRLVETGVFGSAALRDPAATLDAVQQAWLDHCRDRLAAAGVPGWTEAA